MKRPSGPPWLWSREALGDVALSMALAEDGVLLEDEPYADWALRPREALELVRQRARLELARDRARGRGRSAPEAVIEAWEACLAHDPACEEAASSLMRVYSARGQRQAVSVTYERCRAALEALGLRASPALEEAQRATMPPAPRPAPAGAPLPRPAASAKEERRLVSVLFAELSGPVGMGRRLDPEDLRQVVGEALSALIAEVEGLGGTVTSVSGAGLVALFGAPEAHEDDPERAVRAGGRILSAIGSGGQPPGLVALSVRVGIETGPAVVGALGPGAGYGAVGEVVGTAAAVQSAAKAGSVLVGPVTRAATEGSLRVGRRLKMWPHTRGPSRLSPPTWSGPRRGPPATAANAGWRATPPWWAARPSWLCSTTPCEEPHRGQAQSSSWWASPAWARPAWCRNAVSASWPGWAPAPAGCRCGWRAGLPRMRHPPLMVSTSSSCRLGWAPPPRRARRWSAPPWSGL